MAKTILITGASSGIGLATASYFYDKGWNVVATMRTTEKETTLIENERLIKIELDVQDKTSIQGAVTKALKQFGNIDVLVNNAGYGAFGPLEAASEEQINRQYDVNVFGVIRMIKAILPAMKEQKQGTIINITSIGGISSVPFYSLYNSTKFAIEGLSEGLWYDYMPLGIQVKIVEPGGIQTEFSGRSAEPFDIHEFPEHKDRFRRIWGFFQSSERAKQRGKASDVAATIFKAATDKNNTLRYVVGKDAQQIAFFRRHFGYKRVMKMTAQRFQITPPDTKE